MRPIKSYNKFWGIVLCAVCALCVVVILLISRSVNRHVAVIYADGREVCRVDLSRVQESYTIPLDGNTILVEPGSICMQAADCPDKLCVRQGTLHTVGRIVCLPNRVMIEMQSGDADAADAKVG